MRAQRGVPLGEALAQLGGLRVDDVGPGEVDAQVGGLLADDVGVPEQGQVADVAAEQDVRGPQYTLLGALGQDDPAPVGAGLFQQFVLEHHRGDAAAAGHREPLQQGAGVHVTFEETEGGLRLAGRGRVQLAFQREEFTRGGEGSAGHRDDRGARCEAGRQPEYLLAWALVQCQQDARDGRGAGAVRGERADDEVRAVAGGDDHAARGQGLQEVRQHRPAEHEVQRVPGQPRVVAEQNRSAQCGGDLGDGGRGERGVVRQHRAGHGQLSPQPFRDVRAVLGRHPVHDHGQDVAAETGVRTVGVARLGAYGSGVLVLAPDHRDHRGAELVGQPGVQGQFVGQLGRGEVAAEDEDDLVVARHLVEAFDEQGDQFVGALLRLDRGGLLVVQSEHGLRALRQPVAGPQQLEEAVRSVVDERPEDADPVDLTRQ